jgi:hypothetical protein
MLNTDMETYLCTTCRGEFAPIGLQVAACEECDGNVCGDPNCYIYEETGDGCVWCVACFRAAKALREGLGSEFNVLVRWDDLGNDYFAYHPTDDCTDEWSSNAADAIAEWISERVASEYPEAACNVETTWNSGQKFDAQIEVTPSEDLGEDEVDDMKRFAERLQCGANESDLLAELAYDCGGPCSTCSLDRDESAD